MDLSAKVDSGVRDHRTSSAGFALIGLLVTLIILCGLAFIVGYGVGAFNSSPTLSPSGGGTLANSGGSTPTQTGASEVAACNADAKVVETAVTAFEATNNGEVPTVSELSTSSASGPFLQTYPRSEYFTIALDANGKVTVSLSTSDPAALEPHLYPTSKPPFAGNPVPYDTWTWTSAATLGTRYPGAANVCAGA